MIVTLQSLSKVTEGQGCVWEAFRGDAEWQDRCTLRETDTESH